MEESTCQELVIDLFKRFSCMKCLFLHFFISFDAERMTAETCEISRFKKISYGVKDLP